MVDVVDVGNVCDVVNSVWWMGEVGIRRSMRCVGVVRSVRRVGGSVAVVVVEGRRGGVGEVGSTKYEGGITGVLENKT